MHHAIHHSYAAKRSLMHPMVIFWVGVLTGSLLVGLVFLYKAVNGPDYKSAALQGTNVQQSQVQKKVPTPTNLFKQNPTDKKLTPSDKKVAPTTSAQKRGAAPGGDTNPRGLGGEPGTGGF